MEEKQTTRRRCTRDIEPPELKFHSFTIEELRTLWVKYKHGIKRSAMLTLFDITEAQLDEALAAAQAIWGRKPNPEKQQAALQKIRETIAQALEEEQQQKHSTPLGDGPINWKRPPAEYSNRSPYGIASPGLSR